MVHLRQVSLIPAPYIVLNTRKTNILLVGKQYTDVDECNNNTYLNAHDTSPRHWCHLYYVLASKK